MKLLIFVFLAITVSCSTNNVLKYHAVDCPQEQELTYSTVATNVPSKYILGIHIKDSVLLVQGNDGNRCFFAYNKNTGKYIMPFFQIGRGPFEGVSPGAMPNSYIFNNDGKIASLFGNQRDLIEFVNFQAESVLSNTPYNPPLLKEYATGGKKLLQFLDTLISTAHMSLSDNRDSLSTAKNRLLRTDSLDRNYYYHYLMTRIADKLNDRMLRTQHANLAYDLFSSAKNPALFLTLNDRIKTYSSHYKEEAARSAELYFDKEVLNYGKIKPGKKATITIHYNASTKGVFLKNIVFRSNASNKLQKIILDGEVI